MDTYLECILARRTLETLLLGGGEGKELRANGGRSRVELLQTEVPDLILLDVMIPDGNGEEALRLRQEQTHLRDIPVVMMSAGLARHQLNEASVAFLGKSFELEVLLQIVHDTIGPAAPPGSA